MKPVSLRTRLTIFHSLILTVILVGFGLLSYHFLAVLLERTLGQELDDRVIALRGYLQYRDGSLVLDFDPNDPDEAYFVHTATRYYQAFDLQDGSLVVESRDTELLGIRPTSEEVATLARNSRPSDVETSGGIIRFHNSVFQSGPYRFLIRVGISIEPVSAALDQYLRVLLLLIPASVFLAGFGGWEMARRALRPAQELAAAARRIDIERLNERLPLRGTSDELDQMAEAFNYTLARLEAAVAEMKQFTASISHELRTPLTALRGEAEVALLEARSAEDYRRVLGSQLEEFDRLSKIINQLLTLARAEAGEIRLAVSDVDLSSLVGSLADQMEPVASSRNIQLATDTGPGITVRGDASWLERVILNLMDNAFKFTPHGGEVQVTLTANAGQVILCVKDTGVGIPAEALPHIFERFYRAEPSRSKEVEGAGLGLALTKWIVDQHQGRIEVESHPGKGSSFCVLLPALDSGARRLNIS
jgi:heavy metal sensor kinase